MRVRHLLSGLQRILGLLVCIALLTQSSAFAVLPEPGGGERPIQTTDTPPTPPMAEVDDSDGRFPAPPSPPGLQQIALNTKPGLLSPRKVASMNSGEIPLSIGWNLISIPDEPGDTDPAAVLTSIAGSYDEVFAYDGCDGADPWKRYDPTDLPGSDLTAIDHTIGLWVDVTGAASLQVSGTQHVSTTIPLCAGWNLVGYPLSSPQTVDNALASIAGRYTRVFAYDAVSSPDGWDVQSVAADDWGNDLQVMFPGQGYWIFATEATDLIFMEPPGVDITFPVVNVIAMPEIVDVGENVSILVDVNDNIGLMSRSLTVNGVDVPLDENGQADYVPGASGLYTAVGTATDLDGNVGTDTSYFRARTAVDNGPPTVDLTSPVDDSILETPADLIGTAEDTDLVFYELQAKAEEGAEFITFYRGFVSVTADVLGNLDPRFFIPGLYTVRVCAEDTWGNVACTGALKYDLNAPNPMPGVMRMAFLDGVVSAAGMPITVRRFYDSRDKTAGDFGIGWQLSLGDVELFANRVMGDDWQEVQSGNAYGIQATADHRVTISLPDGSFHRFRMHPDPETQPFFPITILDGANFEPLGNTDSTLTANPPPAFFDALNGVITDSSGGIYSPNSYTLTLKNGLKMRFSRNGSVASLTYRLTQIEDRNGNILTISPGGISHSAGVSVGITRDGSNRISAVTDANGNTRTYSYDADGNLAASTDYVGNVTQYRYDDNHNLIQIIDPRGEVPGTMIYDDNWRIVAVIDPSGNRVEIEHNDAIGQEIVTDYLGNQTVISYDARGNTVSVLDALGHSTTYVHDADDNLLSTTNANGETSSWTYDSGGNMLTFTDPLSNTTTYTYDPQGQLLSTTDPLGRTSTFTYDSNGNQLSATDPLSRVVTFEYDGQGNVTSVTDPLGSVVEMTYDGLGRPIQQTDPLGSVSTATYDANGNPLTQSRTRTTLTGTETISTSNQLNANGQVLMRLDPEGNALGIDYSPIGAPDSVMDSSGNAYYSSYDSSGQRIEITQPDGTTMSNTYDPRGLMTSRTDFAGKEVTIDYDAVGRPTTITSDDGSYRMKGFDPVGRLLTYTDEMGNVLTSTYDALGRKTMVDQGGLVLQYNYDAVGNLISKVDGNGEMTSYTYDDGNQLISITYPDGAVVGMTYDDAGRQTTVTDPLGNTTSYGYDVMGRLVVVTDTLGSLTRYSYDEMSNLIAVTDALSRTTSMEYDRLGRMTMRTLPNGLFETFVYDGSSNVTSHTDFAGQTITYTYDEFGRPISKNVPGETAVTYTYYPGGGVATVTDEAGTTTFSYDDRYRPVRVDYPDGTYIEYGYDLAGNLTSRTTPTGATTYTYDNQDRISTVTDMDGGVTTYAYDVGGNLETITNANGTTTAVTYDQMGQIVNLVNRKADSTVISSFDYTYNSAGNRIQMVELDGTVTDYTYDDLGRLIQELVTDNGGGLLNDISYSYDLVGNRMTRTTLTETISYTYDLNDQMLTAGLDSFTYDDNGNMLSQDGPGGLTTYGYNAENKLVSATTPLDSITYGYHSLGIRNQKVVNGVETNYLIELKAPFAEVLAEMDGGGGVTAEYTLGYGQISRKTAVNTEYYHHDAHGSVVQLTDGAQDVVAAYSYDAFGSLTNQSGSSTNPYLYSSEQYDPETDLYYLRARYYAPEYGRFTARDTIFGSPGNPASLHKYVYTGNNPVTRVDPSGNVSAAEALTVASIMSTLQSIQAMAGAVILHELTIIGYYNRNTLTPPAHATRFGFSFGGDLNIGFFSVGGDWTGEILQFTADANQPTTDPVFYQSLGVNAGVGINIDPLSSPISIKGTVEVGHVFDCHSNIKCAEGWAISRGFTVQYLSEILSLSYTTGLGSNGTSNSDYSLAAGYVHDLSTISGSGIGASIDYGVSYGWWWADPPSFLEEMAQSQLAPVLSKEFREDLLRGAALVSWVDETLGTFTAWMIDYYYEMGQ